MNNRSRLALVFAAIAGIGAALAQTPATIQFYGLNPQVYETDQSASVAVGRTGDLATEVTVEFATTNRSATAGLDYLTNAGTLTFVAGETNKTIVIALLNDGLRENTESFNVLLSNPGGSAVLGARQTALVTLFDNDGGFSLYADSPVQENQGAANAYVSRGDDLNATVSVDYYTTNATALAGVDYVEASGTLIFSAGEYSKSIPIPILNDGIKEPTKSFRVRLINPSPGTSLGTPTLANVSIQDNDPGFEFAASVYTVSEAGGLAVLVVKRQDDLDTVVTVDFATTNATATAETDYAATSGTLSFAPGEREQSILVPLINDSLVQGARSFVVRLSNPTGGAALGPRQATTVNIQDNETGFEFVAASLSVNEVDGQARIGVQRQGEFPPGGSVDYFTSDGTATAGVDFTPVSGTLTFQAGETNKSIVLPVLNDGLHESPEFVILTLTNSTGGVPIGFRRVTSVRIDDNDPGIEFLDPSATVVENAGQIVLTVRRQDDLNAPVTVEVTTADGSATVGADYTAVSNLVTFAVGETSKQVTVPLLNDGLKEGREIFYVRLSNPTGGASLGTRRSVTVYIEDNDPGFEFSTTSLSVSEGVGEAILTVLRQDDLKGPATVTLTTQDGSASAGLDYTTVSNVLPFAEGQTSAQISIPLLNDGVKEGRENFIVRLSNPTGGAGLGFSQTMTVDIDDNDPGLDLTSVYVEVFEGQGAAFIEVRRGDDGSDIVKVDYATSAVTATAGVDYVEATGMLTFAAGETAKFITVPILSDGLIETNESFRITLSDLVGGQGFASTNRSATVVIRDNDQPPSIEYVSVSETSGVTSLVLRRSDDGTSPMTVNLAVTGGSATPGIDYFISKTTFLFPPGPGTLRVPFTVFDDALAEGEESIEFTLLSPTAHTTNTSLITIQDDEKRMILDPRFRAALGQNADVRALALHTNGQLLVSFYDPAAGETLQRLNSDGSVDPAFRSALTNGPVLALAVQADGRIVCGGSFPTNRSLARLNANGSLDTTFMADTTATFGTAQQVVIQPDDRIVAGIYPPTVGQRVSIVRLNANGSPDSSFSSATLLSSDYVLLGALTLQTNGQILLGGRFNLANTSVRSGLARLNSDGSLDDSFGPQLTLAANWGAQLVVRSLALQPDQTILAAGFFETANGVVRNGLARFNPDGTLDLSFDTKRTSLSELFAVALQADGRILVGGYGVSDWPVYRFGLARFDSGGAVDTSLQLGLSDLVSRILPCADNTAYIAGGFRFIDGEPCNHLARIFTDSAGRVGVRIVPNLVEAFENSTNVIFAIERLGDSDDSVVVNYATGGGTAAPGADYIAQSGALTFAPLENIRTITIPLLDDGLVEDMETANLTLASTTPGVLVVQSGPAVLQIRDNEIPVVLDRSFASRFSSGSVQAMLVQPDGKVLIGGYLPGTDGGQLSRVLRLNVDGSLDFSFADDVITDGDVRALALAPGGKILVGGYFGQINEVSRNGLARLNVDGSLDTGFVPAPDVYGVRMIAVEADGHVLALADCGPLWRLRPDGSAEGGFSPDFGPLGCAYTVAALPAGQVLVGGENGLVRLNSNGSRDTNFHFAEMTVRQDCCPQVWSILVVDDGKMFVGGRFTHVDGAPRGGVARLNTDGTLDPTFAPTFGARFDFQDGTLYPGTIRSMSLRTDGKLLVGGDFNSLEKAPRVSVGRLNADGSLDASLPAVSLSGDWWLGSQVNAVAELADGNIVIAGNFWSVNGAKRYAIARLFGNGAQSSFEFAEEKFAGGENGGVATITVRRIGDVSGAESVHYQTGPGTATQGADYLAASGTLEFAPLETFRTFTVPLLDDGLEEPDETAGLVLSDATGVSMIGLPEADLRIVDNERPGSLDLTFLAPLNPAYNNYIHRLLVQPDGRLVLSGDLYLSADEHRSVLRLNADGSLDASFKPPAEVYGPVAFLADGHILARTNNALVLLGGNGSIDSSISAAIDWYLSDLAVDEDRIILAGSYYVQSTGTTYGRVRRLKVDGLPDPSFQEPAFNPYSGVYNVFLLRDGRMLINGSFDRVNGSPRKRLARLNTDGSLDTTFNLGPWFDGEVKGIVEQADGRIVIAGGFSVTVGTNASAGIARLNPDGTLDSTFIRGKGTLNESGGWNYVTAIAEQWNGKLIAAGDFQTFHGHPNNGMVALNPDGSLDESFDVGEGFRYRDSSGNEFPSGVNVLARQPNGQVLAGGGFNRVNGIWRIGVVRLNDDFRLHFITPIMLPEGVFRFTLAAQHNRTYVIEVSEDLVHWTGVSTNTAGAEQLVFDDLDTPTTPLLFYRAVQR